jgi:phosphate starvation-inducible protein PhoH
LEDNLEKYEEVIKVSETDNLYELFGIFDENINALMAHTGSTIFLDDNKIVVNGDKPSVILAVKVI